MKWIMFQTLMCSFCCRISVKRWKSYITKFNCSKKVNRIILFSFNCQWMHAEYVTQKPRGWVSIYWAYKEIICSLSSFRTLVSSLQPAILCYTACGHIYESYMCNVQITQQFRWLGTPLVMILRVWPVNQPTIIIVAFCTKQNKKFGYPCFRRWTENGWYYIINWTTKLKLV
jgi:hypothetical protein